MTRTFSVREGSYLLFPVRYVSLDNVDFPVALTVEELRDTAARVVALMTNLHAWFDGQPIDVSAHRVQSPVFSFNFETADNLDSYIYGHPVMGLVDPFISDGFWLMLEPLPPGNHVVQFGGEIGPPFSSSKEVTDFITVIPMRLSDQVRELMALINAAALPRDRLQPLLSSLNAAAASFDSGELRAGINQLGAFQHKVSAQLTRRDLAIAEMLIRQIEQIIGKAAAGSP